MDRRDFLFGVARAAAFCAAIPNGWRVTTRPPFADDPFSLGVASGDPTPTGGVLWTRLAPRPLEPDGGMGGARTAVNWQLADDDKFTRIVKQGRATAAPELGHSVHVDVDGLTPDRWYFYRFTSGEAMSPVGRFRTSPAADATTPLRFAFASCQQYEQGFYTAYDHMSRESLDLMAHLGDYIYEYSPSATGVRKHANPEARDLDGYRIRYAQYKSDSALRAAHEICPWLVIWDDHEVDNNYAGLAGENDMESIEQMRSRRAAAYQAWWENQPVRVPRAQSWADLKIMRTIDWGSLARIFLLDGRQYRSDQSCGDGTKPVPCGDWADPKRTMLGDEQERWLIDGLASSKSRWQVLANQVMMAPYDSAAGPETRVSMDQWSGYPAARDRLLNAIGKHAPNRTVVITGDIHSNWVNELHSDFARQDRPVVAAEFVGTSITSGGDGSDRNLNATPSVMSDNPHLKWQSNRRGYVSCVVGPDTWTADYKTVAYVSKPGAPIDTPTKWRLERGRPGILPA
ncbi:MAG TPA: alkaline phosphatase D family protein [Gemmatimonadaceae bacterium]|nr:alkaline phosphatase D family protein [Gemmatimonadaceae bacterium]